MRQYGSLCVSQYRIETSGRSSKKTQRRTHHETSTYNNYCIASQLCLLNCPCLAVACILLRHRLVTTTKKCRQVCPSHEFSAMLKCFALSLKPWRRAKTLTACTHAWLRSCDTKVELFSRHITSPGNEHFSVPPLTQAASCHKR